MFILYQTCILGLRLGTAGFIAPARSLPGGRQQFKIRTESWNGHLESSVMYTEMMFYQRVLNAKNELMGDEIHQASTIHQKAEPDYPKEGEDMIIQEWTVQWKASLPSVMCILYREK